MAQTSSPGRHPADGQTIDAARRHFDRWAASYDRDRRSRWMAGIQDQALAALDLRPDDVLTPRPLLSRWLALVRGVKA